MSPQVDLRKSKLLWLEAERLKTTARRSAEMVEKNAEDHDQRAKEAARQKGPHRCESSCRCMPRAPAPGAVLQQRTRRCTPEPACASRAPPALYFFVCGAICWTSRAAGSCGHGRHIQRSPMGFKLPKTLHGQGLMICVVLECP